MTDIDEIRDNFALLEEWDDRYRYVIELGRTLEPMPEAEHSAENKVQGCVSQSDIIRAFGVTSISVKRSVKTYREKGPKGFYAPRVTRGPAVLVDAVIAQAEECLADGASVAEVAEQLNVKLNTLQKAIRAGRIRIPVKKKF